MEIKKIGKRKSPELAGILSCLFPGAGHVYIRGFSAGLIWFLGDAFFISWAIYLYNNNPLAQNPDGTFPGFFHIGGMLPMDSVIAMVGYVLLMVISARFASRLAVHHNNEIEAQEAFIKQQQLYKLEEINKQTARAMSDLELPEI